MGTGFISAFSRALFPLVANLLVQPLQAVWARAPRLPSCCRRAWGRLPSCCRIKSGRTTLMTALLLLAFVVAHGARGCSGW